MKRDRDRVSEGRRKRLSLNRETLRVLSARELAGVAGGDFVVVGGPGGRVYTIIDPDIDPRTNAWTGDDPDGLCD